MGNNDVKKRETKRAESKSPKVSEAKKKREKGDKRSLDFTKKPQKCNKN